MPPRTRTESSGSPPLLAGRVHGLREWSLVVDGGGEGDWLGAIARDVVWPRRAAMRAVCVPGGALGEHPAPAPNCDCGIYALHPSGYDASGITRCGEDEVVGVVEAWGRLELHESGFRAEYAKPVALLAYAGAGHGYRMRVARAAAAYGVEYVELDSAAGLGRYRAERLAGLDADAVDDLLLHEREVVVTPTVSAFMTKRGRAVGGFGYSLENGTEPTPWQVEVPSGERGVVVLRVAGTSHRSAALESETFDPGRPLRLVPEPTNSQDRHAVAVWDAELRLRLGYVPRAHAPEVGRRLRTGRVGRAISLRDWRDLRDGRRFALHMLISQSPRVRVVDREQRPLIQAWSLGPE